MFRLTWASLDPDLMAKNTLGWLIPASGALSMGDAGRRHETGCQAARIQPFCY